MGTGNQQLPRVVSVCFFLTQFGTERNQKKQNRPATLKQSEPNVLPNRVNSHTAGNKSLSINSSRIYFHLRKEKCALVVLVQGTVLLFAWDCSQRKEVSARGSVGHSASPRGWDSGTLTDPPQRGQEDCDLTAKSLLSAPLGSFGYVGKSLHGCSKERRPQTTGEVDMKRQH